jgi:hypothetical protein
MAKQHGIIKITGTFSDTTFYKMNGEYYVKQKSRVNSSRLKNQPNYALFRLKGSYFGRASKLVKSIYYSFDKQWRVHGLYGKMVAYGYQFTKLEKTDEEVKALLLEKYGWMAMQQPVVAEAPLTLMKELSILGCSEISKDGLFAAVEREVEIKKTKEIKEVLPPVSSNRKTRLNNKNRLVSRLMADPLSNDLKIGYGISGKEVFENAHSSQPVLNSCVLPDPLLCSG